MPSKPFTPFPDADVENSVAACFAARAEVFADRVAISGRDGELTYHRALHRRAAQIASAIDQTPNTDTSGVTLLLDHGTPFATGMLAVLGAARAYVPLNQSNPAETNRRVLADAGVRLLLADSVNMDAAHEIAGEACPVPDIDSVEESDPFPRPGIEPGDLAGIFYTSGTTGEPKGVVHSQRNFLHAARCFTNSLEILGGDRLRHGLLAALLLLAPPANRPCSSRPTPNTAPRWCARSRSMPNTPRGPGRRRARPARAQGHGRDSAPCLPAGSRGAAARQPARPVPRRCRPRSRLRRPTGDDRLRTDHVAALHRRPDDASVLLRPRANHVVLEIGTGSGYQAAVLSPLVRRVCTIEIISGLARTAAAALSQYGYRNVETRTGDGYHGWPECGPFDGIVVTAAASHIPPPLVRQLKPGGRMVIPVGSAFLFQHLTLVEKDAEGKVTTRQMLPVSFVPFVRAE